MATERKVVVGSEAQHITLSSSEGPLSPFRVWLYVPEAVQLVKDLQDGIEEAIRKGRERQRDAEHAANGCCR